MVGWGVFWWSGVVDIPLRSLRRLTCQHLSGHPPAFALLRVPLRFAKGEGRFLAALGMTARGSE